MNSFCSSRFCREFVSDLAIDPTVLLLIFCEPCLPIGDIRDQLAGLCERVEVFIESNPNATDIVPIQKAITSGYFYCTVSLYHGPSTLVNFTYSLCLVGSTTKEWRFVSDDENPANGIYPSVIEFVPATASSQIYSVLRACYDVEVLYEVCRIFRKM